MALGISQSFSRPFFEGGPTSSVLVPEFLPVSIAGHLYLIDPKEYRRRYIPALREATDNSEEPGERTFNPEGAFPRSQSDWSGGAGQEYFDRADSERRRYFSSKGLDPWISEGGVGLLNSTEEKRSSVESNLLLMNIKTATDEYLYLADGQSILFTVDGTASSPSFTTITGTPAQDVEGLATDGNIVWAAFGTSGIYSSTSIGASTMASLTSGTYTGVFYANGRLFATNDNIIYEINAAGTAASIYAHNQTGFRWRNLVDGPGGVYAAGNGSRDSDRGEIYFISVGNDGNLTAARQVGRLPDGESLLKISEYGGQLFLATSRGVRVGFIDANNNVLFTRIVDIDKPCYALESQGDFMWFGWSNYDSSSTGLGRIALGEEFTERGTPVYSSDLMATDQGKVLSIASHRNKRFFAVDAKGFYGETDTLVPSGTLVTGWISFGTSLLKTFSSLQVSHNALSTGGSIFATLEALNGKTNDIGISDDVGSTSSGRMSLRNLRDTLIRLHFTITPGSENVRLLEWIAEALPVTRRIQEFQIPIVADENLSWHGSIRDMNVGEELSYLESLVSERTLVTYSEGRRSYVGYVDDIQFIPDGKWTDDLSWMTGIIMVRLVTV